MLLLMMMMEERGLMKKSDSGWRGIVYKGLGCVCFLSVWFRFEC